MASLLVVIVVGGESDPNQNLIAIVFLGTYSPLLGVGPLARRSGEWSLSKGGKTGDEGLNFLEFQLKNKHKVSLAIRHWSWFLYHSYFQKESQPITL